jgi:hypothetical protein
MAKTKKTKRGVSIKANLSFGVSEEPKPKKTTSRRTWKLFEQRVADLFGAKRTPLSGMSNAITKADIIHNHVFAECKLRASMPVWDLFIETEEKAKKEDKIPLVALQKKNQKGFLLLLRPEDLEKIIKHVKRKGEILESRT